MTDTTTLNRGEWRTALERVTENHEGREVTIEVMDPELGPGYEAERLPFAYIDYDPKDDVVVIGVGGRTSRYPVVLRHLVYHPSTVDIAEGDVPMPAVRIVEPDGTITLVRFFTEASHLA
jgi:hypothetical protein